MYEQLIQPNLSVVGRSGLCLVYVREMFGVAAEYPSATVAWQNAQFKHAGEQPPAAAVPIWFSWQTDGHVAVWDNGTIYSTTAQGDKTFPSIQALVEFIGDGIVYLGWSEDINNVRVVEEDMPSTIGAVEARILVKDIYGYTNEFDIEGAIPSLIGMESNTAIRLVDSDPTGAAFKAQIEAWRDAPSPTGTVLKPGNYTVK